MHIHLSHLICISEERRIAGSFSGITFQNECQIMIIISTDQIYFENLLRNLVWSRHAHRLKSFVCT